MHSPISESDESFSSEPVAEVHTEEGADPPSPPPPPSFYTECREKLSLNLLLSVLSVACWSLAGNAARLALHTAFLSIPFMGTYEFFGPNCLGCFAMGLVSYGLPPEKDMPIIHRAIGVGFCGSFTTFSSWVVDVVNKNTAGGAFEELISGLTMPFLFFLWGKDVALGLRYLGHKLSQCCHTEATEDAAEDKHEESSRHEYRVVQYGFLALSCAAAIAIPIGLQVRIHQGRMDTVSSADIKAVALGPAGAVIRFLLSVFLNKRAPWRGFPVGTLLANALGCLLVVFMDNYAHHRPENLWFWIVANGVCGALSTVSSFVNEVAGFYAANRMCMAYVYTLVTVAVTVTIGAVGRRGNYN